MSPGGQRVGYKRLIVPRLGAGQLWHRPTACAASPKIPQHPGGLGEQGVEVDAKLTLPALLGATSPLSLSQEACVFCQHLWALCQANLLLARRVSPHMLSVAHLLSVLLSCGLEEVLDRLGKCSPSKVCVLPDI